MIDIRPTILPAPWRPVPSPTPGANAYQRPGLVVLVSADIELDGRPWLHASVSRRDRLPSWEDLNEVKDIFVGKDRKAVQVLPPEVEKVNVHPFCLHLFSCLSEALLPDFTRGMGIL